MNNQLIKSNNIKDIVSSEGVKNRLKEIMGDRGAAFGAALVQIVKQSNQLQKCEPNSVIGAALTAAALDLSVDPNLGEAHLIPYGDQCQFQIGFKGFIQLAMRSGEYKAFGSTIVHEGELVQYDELTGELVVDKSKRATDKIIGYAAKFKLLNGFERGEFWTCEEIEQHASQYSKQYRYAKSKPDKHDTCLWITKRDEMAIKTVEKSLLNHYGPKSVQMKKAIVMDGGAIINAESGELEYIDNPKESEITSPEFQEGTGATVEVEPVKQTPKVAKVAPAPSQTPKPDPLSAKVKPPSEKVAAIRRRIADHGLTVEKILAALVRLNVIDTTIVSIEQLEEKQHEILVLLEGELDGIADNIKASQ